MPGSLFLVERVAAAGFVLIRSREANGEGLIVVGASHR